MSRPLNSPEYRTAFVAMGSDCEVLLAASSQRACDKAAIAAIREVVRIEEKYSRYRDDSVVTAINRNAGLSAVATDAETAYLLDYMGTLFQASSGLFDATSGILRHAWNFKDCAIPPEEHLQRLLPLIGWQHVELDAGSAKLRLPGMELDFGGVGKEYAADRAANILLEKGMSSGFVNLGGDIRVVGPHPDGSPWLFGIRHPRNANETIASVEISSGALATSGDYERYFELDNKRYCHILDPRTGHPVTAWRSISIIAPLAVAAGSYATIAMLKQDEALSWLEESDVAYIAMDQVGSIFKPPPGTRVSRNGPQGRYLLNHGMEP